MKEEIEYERQQALFVESMVGYCHCEPYSARPCDGVLAGGLCDGFKEDDGWANHNVDDDDEDYR